jgi:hypothetical protein
MQRAHDEGRLGPGTRVAARQNNGLSGLGILSFNRRSFGITAGSASHLFDLIGPSDIGRGGMQSIESGALADPFERCSPKSYARAVVLSGVL